MNIAKICFAAGLLALSPSPIPAQPNPGVAIPALLEQYKIPSVSVARIVRGTVVFVATYATGSDQYHIDIHCMTYRSNPR